MGESFNNMKKILYSFDFDCFLLRYFKQSKTHQVVANNDGNQGPIYFFPFGNSSDSNKRTSRRIDDVERMPEKEPSKVCKVH